MVFNAGNIDMALDARISLTLIPSIRECSFLGGGLTRIEIPTAGSAIGIGAFHIFAYFDCSFALQDTEHMELSFGCIDHITHIKN
jgi:hypothetical protein